MYQLTMRKKISPHQKKPLIPFFTKIISPFLFFHCPSLHFHLIVVESPPLIANAHSCCPTVSAHYRYSIAGALLSSPLVFIVR